MSASSFEIAGDREKRKITFTPQSGYKAQTLGTLVQGLCGIAGVFVLKLIFIDVAGF